MRIKIDKNSRARNYRNYEENRRKPDSRFHRAREREMLYRLGVTGCCSRVALSEMLRGFADSLSCAPLLCLSLTWPAWCVLSRLKCVSLSYTSRHRGPRRPPHAEVLAGPPAELSRLRLFESRTVKGGLQVEFNSQAILMGIAVKYRLDGLQYQVKLTFITTL